LIPKRLTTRVDISKQFLIQESKGAEEMLKRDIINSIYNKLEASIFSDTNTTGKPTGLFAGITALTNPIAYGDLIALETELETANIPGNKYFVLSPYAKGLFKTTLKTAGLPGYFMEDNEINGYEGFSSSAVKNKGLLFGNFENLIIAQWGGFDITVDPYSQAANGMIRLVVSAYFNFGLRNANSIKRIVLA
jgi:hypothetical protein